MIDTKLIRGNKAGKSQKIIPIINDVLASVPEYGFVSFKLILHQGEIIRIETTKSISEKFGGHDL